MASFVFLCATWSFRSCFGEAGLVALRDEASSKTYNVLKACRLTKAWSQSCMFLMTF